MDLDSLRNFFVELVQSDWVEDFYEQRSKVFFSL